MTTPLHPTNKSTPHQLRVATNHPLPRAGFAACEGPASPLPPARQSQRAIPASSTMPRTEEAGICAPRSPSAHNKTRVGRGREGAAPPRVVETANGHGWGRCASANATAPSFVQANKKTICREGVVPFVPSIRTQQQYKNEQGAWGCHFQGWLQRQQRTTAATSNNNNNNCKGYRDQGRPERHKKPQHN